MRKILFMVLLLTGFFTLSSYAQEGQFITATSLQDLLTKAKKEKRLLFIDSYFVGCHPCKQMDDEVFPLPGVMQLMKENFINVRIDFMKEDLGKELQVKYAVTGFPTFLILNNDGQLVSRFSGYKEADKFTTLLKEAVAKAGKGQVMKGFSPSLTVNYPDFYTAFFKERKSIDAAALAKYMTDQKDQFTEGSMMPMLVARLGAEQSDFFLKNYYKIEGMYGKELANAQRGRILDKKVNEVLKNRDDQKFETFLKEIQPLVSKADWPYVQLDIAEDYFYKLHKDHKAFFKYAIANTNDDDNKVRYMAMYLYGDKVDDEEKQLYATWMKKVVNENSSLEVLGTATGLMMKANNKQKAKEYATWGLKKAKVLNKNTKYYEDSLAKLSS